MESNGEKLILQYTLCCTEIDKQIGMGEGEREIGTYSAD